MTKRKSSFPQAQPRFAANKASPLLQKLNALSATGQFDAALDLLEQATPQESDNAEVMTVAGVCAYSVNDLELAEYYWSRAVAINPTLYNIYSNLGVVLESLSRFDEAESSLRKAIAIKPDFAEGHSNLGDFLEKQKRFVDAEACYRQAIIVNPKLAGVHRNLGNMLLSLNRDDEAEAYYRKAIALQRNFAEAYGSLGYLLVKLQRFKEAEACYRQALAYNHNLADVHLNLGSLLLSLKRHDEVDACFHHALSLKPNYPDAEWNISIMLLAHGRFAEGWLRHKARNHPEFSTLHTFLSGLLPYPEWQGQSLQGKTIVLWPEQGYGDQIQFCRYNAILKQLGAAKIILVCSVSLITLLKTLANVDAVISLEEAEKLKSYDYWSLMLSLPLHCGTTTFDAIPAALPYLHAPEERIRKWSQSLPVTGYRIGLVWKGSSTHKNDQNRSISNLRTLAPLWRIPGVQFISLQKGQGEDEADNPPDGQAILALGDKLEDFADTAAIVSQLDLVICVDTAIAHLAGALNKPCWVLLGAVGTDWRWLLERATVLGIQA